MISTTTGIVRVSRVVGDLARTERFYHRALGFRTIADGAIDTPTHAALGAGDASQIVMQCGEQEVAFVQFATQGLPYPAERRSNDLWFQHLAIVVADMDRAYAHLSDHAGWTAISTNGPALLPPANGSVRAFKFRDPDGHPLELLWFPPGQGRPLWQQRSAAGLFLGIDHSALAVADTGRSVTFYQTLGFNVGNRSCNHGPAQARLDALPGACVSVTGLRPADPASMGLELLAYQPPGRPADTSLVNDRLTDWVTLAAPGLPGAMRDPDGHLLLLLAQRP